MTDETTPVVAIAPEKTRTARDVATVIAISITAFAIANLLHEGLGHGGACVLVGGHARVLSSVYFECDHDTRFIAAAGTLVNFFVGFVSWITLRAVNPSRPHLRYFLWLFMTINLLQGSGYFLFSGVGNIGDWAYVIHDLSPAWIWRAGLTVLGVVSYPLLVWFSLLELRPFLSEHDWRHGGAKDMTVIPYLTGGILYTVAGMLNPVSMALVGVSVAAASFGGSSRMAWMTQLLGSKFVPKITNQPFALPRSPLWIIAALTTVTIFMDLLGPGIRFPV